MSLLPVSPEPSRLPSGRSRAETKARADSDTDGGYSSCCTSAVGTTAACEDRKGSSVSFLRSRSACSSYSRLRVLRGVIQPYLSEYTIGPGLHKKPRPPSLCSFRVSDKGRGRGMLKSRKAKTNNQRKKNSKTLHFISDKNKTQPASFVVDFHRVESERGSAFSFFSCALDPPNTENHTAVVVRTEFPALKYWNVQFFVCTMGPDCYGVFRNTWNVFPAPPLCQGCCRYRCLLLPLSFLLLLLSCGPPP